MALLPLRGKFGDFLGDFKTLTTPISFSGEGVEPAPELRLDDEGLTFVSKWRKLQKKKKKKLKFIKINRIFYN